MTWRWLARVKRRAYRISLGAGEAASETLFDPRAGFESPRRATPEILADRGYSGFLESIGALLKPAAGLVADNGELDALSDKLKALKMKTGLDMKSFLNAVIDELAKAKPHTSLAKSKRSLPNFLIFYRNLFDDSVIEKLALAAAQAHSRTHSTSQAA